MSSWGAATLSPGQVAYAASDAVLAHRLWAKVAEGLRRTRRVAVYELQRAAIPPVAAMELRGLSLDRVEHDRQVRQWTVELADARRQYRQETGRTPPSKTAEYQEWMRTVLDPAEPARWPRTEGGQISTETKHLKRLIHNVPSARAVLSIRAREKLIENFGPRLAAQINRATDRLHASYNIAGSKSGRFTCSRPLHRHRAGQPVCLL